MRWLIGAVLAAAVVIGALWLGRPREEPPAEPRQATAATGAEETAPAQNADATSADGAAAQGAGESGTAAAASGTGGSEAETAEAEEVAAAQGEVPSFDIVTVDPSGRAVIAGRAAPGALVTVLLGGEPMWNILTDARGEFVLLPEAPLPPGTQTLTLEARLGGGAALVSAQAAVLEVPARGADAGQTAEEGAGGGAMVAIVEPGPDTAPVLADPTGAGLASQGGLVLDLIDDAAGEQSVLQGRAPAGTEVRAYVGETLVGRAVADDAGRWSIAAALPPAADGTRALRLDQVDAAGNVLARVATTIEPVASAAAPAPGTVVVVPGNTLWQIARTAYGGGPLYTLIFKANQDQISDPDLIYPGQVFVLPPPEGDGG